MTSYLILLTLAPQTFDFKGGSDYELAKALFSETGKPVVILANPDQRWKRVRINYEEGPAELRKKLTLALGMTSGPSWGFGDAAYPQGFFFLLDRQKYVNGFVRVMPIDGRRGNKITLVTSKGPVSLSMAVRNVSKRLTWHWFFQDAVVSAHVQAAGEEELVETIATAIGARLVKNDKGYYFDFDPEQYANRGASLLRRLAAAHPKRGGPGADYLYSAAVLDWVSGDKLASLFAMPGQTREVSWDATANKAVQAAAFARLRSLFPVEDDGVERHVGWHQLWARQKDRIDWSRPPHVTASQYGTFGCKFFGKPEYDFNWTF